MLKQLFGTISAVESAMRDLDDMLVLSSKMITAAIDELTQGTPIPFDVYKEDQELNKIQMEIRRKVIRHLSLNPQKDILAFVTLVNVIIFVERLGDYAKNIHEMSIVLDGPFTDVTSHKELLEISNQVKQASKIFRSALSAEKERDAQAILDLHKQISMESKKIIDRLVGKRVSDLPYSALAAMYARYLKRISAHMMNAASTVINAFDMIGFYPGKEGTVEDDE